MPTFRKNSGIPLLTGDIVKDVTSIYNALYGLEEELRYMFNNLGDDNFGDGVLASLRSEDGHSASLELSTESFHLSIVDELSEKYSQLASTVDNISLKVVAPGGEETSVNLNSEKLDISFLGNQISDAEKVATNFISMTKDGGIEVGNRSGGSWTGYRTQMAEDAFNILNTAGKKVASYGASEIGFFDSNDAQIASFKPDTICLGMSGSTDTAIDFNNGMAILRYDTSNERASLDADTIAISSGTGGDVLLYSREALSDEWHGAEATCRGSGVYLSGFTQWDQYTVDVYCNLSLKYDGTGLWESFGFDSNGSPITSSIELKPSSLKIRGSASPVTWVNARDGALLALTPTTFEDAWYPAVDIKTINGDWSIGNLGVSNYLYFSYVTDANYNDGSNSSSKYYIDPLNGWRMSGSDAVNRYYISESSYSGKSYSIGVGIGTGGINRGVYDFTREHWTLCNDATDTIFRSIGAFYFRADTDASTIPKDIVIGNSGNGHPLFRPGANGYGYLGGTQYRWNNIYTSNVNTTNAVTVSSDRRLKKDISYDLTKMDKVIDLLKPAVYRMIDDEEELIRFGFIAQDAEQAFIDAGLNPDDYAFISKNETEDGVMLSLGYTETNALLWHRQQQLEQRIAELEKRIA